MNLKGAELRNFYEMTTLIPKGANVVSANSANIPIYQRPYTWKPKQVGKLIEDFEENRLTTNLEYFAGSILTTVDNSPGLPHQIIDGQQRYTTLFLINFINFSILRVYIREVLISGNPYGIGAVSGHLQKLKNASDYLFKDKQILTEIDNFDAGLTTALANDTFSSNSEKFVNTYLGIMGLPENSIESDASYQKEYFASTKQILKKYALNLEYSRSFYSDVLVESLASVIIKLSSQNACSCVIEKQQYSPNNIASVESYTDNLEEIFKLVNRPKTSASGNSIPDALLLSDFIEEALQNIKVCIIQTGDANDAFTLFEVLNDRAKALDDLDLIKNQFYKYFCLSTSSANTSNPTIQLNVNLQNSHLDLLDNKWLKDIYSTNRVNEKRLITYFATSYMTGDTTIKSSPLSESRNKIEDYLKNQNGKYGQKEVDQDFAILEATKQILTKFDYSFSNQDLSAVESEYDINKSTLYKAIHFLNALGQEGVIAGLINVILFTYHRDILKGNSFSLEYTENGVKKTFEDYLKTLVKYSKKPVFPDIERCAQEIWRWSMSTFDAISPKREANNLISNYNLRTLKNTQINNGLSSITNIERLGFKEEMNSFEYKKNAIKTLKLRILFARLLKTTYTGTGNQLSLSYQTTPPSIPASVVKEMQLDHLEPSNFDENNSTAYFMTNNKLQRTSIINGLGNMFPLIGSLNNAKNNAPLCMGWQYITNDQAGNPTGISNQFIYTDAITLFNANKVCPVNKNSQCSKKELADETVGVPTKQFFEQRQALLLDLFTNSLDL